MIKLKINQYGQMSFYGDAAVYKYFEPYMDKDVFNDTFCHCGAGEDAWLAWTAIPREYNFTKKDWKIVTKGFKHFGINLEEVAQ